MYASTQIFICLRFEQIDASSRYPQLKGRRQRLQKVIEGESCPALRYGLQLYSLSFSMIQCLSVVASIEVGIC
jgi:hypothetical protein